MNEYLFSIEKRTKAFVWALFVLSILSSMLFFILLKNGKTPTEKIVENSKTDHFAKIELEAKSAFVFDVINNRIIYSKNSTEILPIASLTKVMTAITTKESVKNRGEIVIKEDHLTPDGDSGLVVGDKWDLKDLLDFTLLTSSNDGAKALALASAISVYGNSAEPNGETLFINLMNKKAREIGLLNTKFFNEHGLDRSLEKGGAYGSAEDMAKLFEYAIRNHPELLEATRYDVLGFLSKEKAYLSRNTNKFIDKIPNIIASKTGFTDLAGGNLVIVFDLGINRPIIISVLGSSEKGRFDDVLKLADASIKTIEEE